MGFGISKQVNITDHHRRRLRATAIVFSKEDAELVLKVEEMGTYLLYRDYDTDRLYLSVRSLDTIDHHRINFEDNLYYMDNQPYPYLDSIILYHQRHKLHGTKLTHHAHLSARTVKSFTAKVVKQNGNISGANNYNIITEHDGQTDKSLLAVEHTNDDTFGKHKISKSSGRLWRTGLNDKALSRMSMPLPETLQNGEYLGGSFRSEFDVRHSELYYPNGHIVPRNDSFDDVNDDIFDDGNKRSRGNSDSIDGSSLSQDGHWTDNEEASVYDTHL